MTLPEVHPLSWLSTALASKLLLNEIWFQINELMILNEIRGLFFKTLLNVSCRRAIVLAKAPLF